MLPITYDETLLHHLDAASQKEFLLVNEFGTYSSSSIILYHTRKYHGLLTLAQPSFNNEHFVLLSCLDETIMRSNKKYELSTHQYPNTIHPQGYRFMHEFYFKYIPQWTFVADDIVLQKELLLAREENRLLIRYTVKEAKTPFQLSFTPLLAFRNIHTLSKSNLNVDRGFVEIANGVKIKPYPDFNPLCMQYSRKTEYVHAPDWYYNIEYKEELERGYEYAEDLYGPGQFIVRLRQGDKLIFSAGETEIAPRRLLSFFEGELNGRIPLTDYDNCLLKAADQFIVRTDKGKAIIAGYHWFGRWGRDTFIALPGLTLATGRYSDFKIIVDTIIEEMKEGLFPNAGTGNNISYNSVDAPLWFIWALQQYAAFTDQENTIWNDYGRHIKIILESYRKGTLFQIRMNHHGLIEGGSPKVALTWMDALVDDVPVTPRTGMAVEVNALWYNAICFAIESARLANDKKFIEAWEPLSQQIRESFHATFTDEHHEYLADVVKDGEADWSLRPNQVIAASLPFPVVEDHIIKQILKVVEEKLLTPYGLRSLSPDEADYLGHYEGSQKQRDLAYHQGTVWLWLLGPFAEAYLKFHGEEGIPFIENLLKGIEPMIEEKCLYSLPEIFDGEAPHRARGAIAQAWSVAEILRIKGLLKNFGKRKTMDSTKLIEMVP